MKRFPFHPIAFASYPVITFMVANMHRLPHWKLYRALGVSSLAVLILFCSAWIFTRNLWKTGAVTTLISILFFSYGHVYEMTATDSDPVYWLSALWLIILIVGVWWFVYRTDKLQTINYVLNWISVFLLLMALIPLAANIFQKSQDMTSTRTGESLQLEEFSLPENLPTPFPDIYYIVLDGYARADILSEIYTYDNNPLLAYLEERGFFIADKTFSNYNQTILSFPSSMNMAYIQNLVDTSQTDSFDYWELVDFIRKSTIFSIAADAGYELVVFQSGHSATDIRRADHLMRPVLDDFNSDGVLIPILGKQIHLDLYEIRFLETTATRLILSLKYRTMPEDPKYEAHRHQISYTFTNLDAFASEEGPHFIFAHIIAPHPPFVFQADGEPKRNWRPYTIFDGSHWIGAVGTRSDYISGYRDQIAYINSLLMLSIDKILTNSENPPVIIIQGDHGPGAYFDWNSLERTNLNERMGIINAYYFPGGDQGWLYPTITPVNTFRVVFNRYFGMDLELHEDRAFFSEWRDPYHFTEVTDELVENSMP